MKLPLKVALSAALLIIIFMLMLFSNIHKQLTNNAKESLNQKLIDEQHSINKQIDQRIDTIINSLKLTSIYNKNVLSKDDITKKRYDYFLKNLQGVENIIFIPLNGQNIIISSKDSIIKAKEKSLLYKKNLQKFAQEDLTISPIYYDDNILSLDLSLVVRDINTFEKLGVLIAQVSLKNIQEFIVDKLVNFDAVVLTNLNDKKFIYKSTKSENIPNEYFFKHTPGIKNIKANGQNYLLSSSRYHKSNLDLNISLIINEENLFKDITDTLKENLLKLFILIFITTIALILLMKQLLRPLNRLTESIKKKLQLIENDKFDNSMDEISQLKLYFLKFTKIIEDKNKALESFNKELQEKVDKEVKKNQENQKHLMQQNRLAQMGEMINMIAHQWRQPLTAIGSTTNTLLIKSMMGKYDKELFNEKLENINNYTQHLSLTIDDFRNFFKKTKEKRQISLSTICEDSLNIIQTSLYNKNITVQKNYQCNSKLFTYPNELRQVVLNLIKNAEDVLIEKDIENKKINIDTLYKNEKFIIRISDNAGGIPKDIIKKIFEPYYSTKLEKDGTGLGLYMSKTIIEDHCRGKIYAENDENGAVFTIELEDLS
jgi:signal transduction histidine kinase